MMRRNILIALVFGCSLSSAQAAKKASAPKPKLEVTVTPKHPSIGQETEIAVEIVELEKGQVVRTPVEGAEITIIYRPNTQVVDDKTKLKTGVDGTVKWRPTSEGIVSVQAVHGEMKDVGDCAVKFKGIPTLGVVIFAIAFLVLFGGMTYSLYKGA